MSPELYFGNFGVSTIPITKPGLVSSDLGLFCGFQEYSEFLHNSLVMT